MRTARWNKAGLCRVGTILAAILAGCAAPPRPAQAPAPLPPSAQRPVAAIPPAAAPSPVYRNPTIGMVYLRAHQDAEGRLLGPQVMYQIVDPGGWNLEALEGPSAPRPRPEIVDDPHSPLLDPARAAQITITGLMQIEDRPQAEALAKAAGEGHSAVFDVGAGWLILPPEGGGR